MAQLRSHHLGHSKAFKNGILSELPLPHPPSAAALRPNGLTTLICNHPSENPGYGPALKQCEVYRHLNGYLDTSRKATTCYMPVPDTIVLAGSPCNTIISQPSPLL